MNTYTEEQIVISAGLLHDIGKLISRCDAYIKIIGAENGTHMEGSYKFLQWLDAQGILTSNPILEELVKRHHESKYIKKPYLVAHCEDDHTRKLAYIVSRADTYSSKDRREETSEEKHDYKLRPLDSVLEHIKFSDATSKATSNHYKLNPLQGEAVIPQSYKANTQDELKSLIDKFVDELKEVDNSEFDTFLTQLDLLCRKYLWCIPADTTKEISDISLYEHSRTTAAFAQCIYKYHIHNGLTEENIKNYDLDMFAILAIEFDGLSEYVETINTNNKATKRLRGKVARANIIKEETINDILNKLQLSHLCKIWEQNNKVYLILPNIDQQIDVANNMIDAINTKLYTDFDGKIYLNTAVIKRSGDDIQNFNETMYYTDNQLQKNLSNKWNNLILTQPITTSYEHSISRCNVCDDYTVKKGQACCDHCGYEIQLGDMEERTFEELADGAKGVKYLGVLRCKIKSLDLLYQFGLIDKKEDSTSISRLGTINMLLRQLFVDYLPKTLGEQFENCIVIDSNDEGMLIVGAWNEIFNVAKEIKAVFDKFVGKNPDLQLYMAIDLFKKKQPARPSLQKTMFLLEQGMMKERPITIFDYATDWATFDELLIDGEYVEKAMQTGILSQSFIYKLREFADQMQDYGETQNMESLMYMSRLNYAIGRNLDRQKHKEIIAKIETWYCLKGDINLDVMRNKGQIIKIILNYAVYIRRGE
ncbi:MAG: type III-A CRISPR-associated protein Cas10/Csm1 [Epulopiscium sp. Nele67-Bin004]|nr:MAG: type III-A CRISPR-associated protein Cas10/Csm1 [Epulopiscium sp. Nele67-Bin004]